MPERTAIDPEALKARAFAVVERLNRAKHEDKRTYPPYIQVVFVFSGPGSYYTPLKEGQDPIWRWMDRDRIRAGVAFVRDVTAARMTEILGGRVKVNQLTHDDIREHGPILFYNGVPSTDENTHLRVSLAHRTSKMPADRVIIVDQVREPDGTVHGIGHTADQVKSFYNEVRDPQSPLYQVTRVALIAHDTDHIRNPFYTKLHNDIHVAKGFPSINFHIVGLESRPGTKFAHIESEMPRLVTYAERGHLATEPSPFTV